METKTLVIITITGSSITTLLWVLGLIFARFDLFVLAIIISLMSLVLLKNKYLGQISEFFSKKNGEVVDDERSQYIEAKSSTLSFGALIAVSIYSAVAIFTLRNIYPQYIDLAYPFLAIIVIGLIANMITKAYYKRRYGD